MKKLIALIAGTAVMLSMTMTSFASFDTEIKANEDGITYTAALTGDAATANAGKQTTIVAYKGDTIEVGSIQFINQDAATSFTFQLKDELTEDVKVVMGGEAIDKQEIGTIKYAAEATTVALGGTITGYYAGTADLPTVTVDGYEDAVVVNDDGTWEVEGGVEPGTYAIYASKPYHTYHSISALEVANDTTDVALEVYAGDLDESIYVDVDDIGIIIDNYFVMEGDDTWEDVKFADIDESFYIDVDDIGYIIDNYFAISIDE